MFMLGYANEILDTKCPNSADAVREFTGLIKSSKRFNNNKKFY